MRISTGATAFIEKPYELVVYLSFSLHLDIFSKRELIKL